MLPKGMTEASCAKCHKQQVFVPKAERLNVAYATYERAGCYACHKTKGFDTDIRKPGPILTKIDSKLSQDWVKNWIRNPRAVKPTTWMPRFWYNSNNSGPEDAAAQRGGDQRHHRLPVRELREARARREEPAARRRQERREDRQVDRLPGLPRRRRGVARGGGAAPDLRPAAREHRQQDQLRVGLQLGPRSEALQRGHLHAGPAPDRRPGGGRRHLPDGPEGRRRRRRQGAAGSEGRRRGPARLPEGRAADRGRAGRARRS